MQKDHAHICVNIPKDLKLRAFSILAAEDTRFTRWLIMRLEEFVAKHECEQKESAYAGA